MSNTEQKHGIERMTDAIMADIDKKADRLKQNILTSATTVRPAENGFAYYVSADGDDSNSGTSPEYPWKTLEKVNEMETRPGDAVYFRRGDCFRGNLTARAGTAYSAYGEGIKPVICASRFDGARVGVWEETDVPMVYRYSERIANDVGLLVFDKGRSYAIKVVAAFDPETRQPLRDHATKLPFAGYADLPADLFFYHDLGAPSVSAADEKHGYIYLRSDKGNPADRFSSIEFNWRGNIIGIRGDNITIDNLCITHGGCHGVGSGTANGLTVQNCEFAWIGGSLQFYAENGRPVRFGNAVEIYGLCKDYTVQNCYIHDVYDAGVTHQRNGPHDVPIIMEDILYDSNLFVNCIYSIEYFNDQPDDDNNIMRNMTFSNNICRNAGGFGWQRCDKVARHIQGGWLGLKREYPAENYVVKNNIFDRSCDTLLSISSTDIKDMPVLEGNTYIQYAGRNFGMVGVPYDRYYPYDSEVEHVIRELSGDADARIIMIVDEVKSNCEPDLHVMECYANIAELNK